VWNASAGIPLCSISTAGKLAGFRSPAVSLAFNGIELRVARVTTDHLDLIAETSFDRCGAEAGSESLRRPFQIGLEASPSCYAE
jgi:hypothetical protein